MSPCPRCWEFSHKIARFGYSFIYQCYIVCAWPYKTVRDFLWPYRSTNFIFSLTAKIFITCRVPTTAAWLQSSKPVRVSHGPDVVLERRQSCWLTQAIVAGRSYEDTASLSTSPRRSYRDMPSLSLSPIDADLWLQVISQT